MKGRRRATAGIAVALLALGCAPRQARVETDPRGGEETRLRLEATIRSDLAALLAAQEEFRAEAGRYTYEAAELGGFEPSGGIEIDILEASADGFSAIGRAGTVECALFAGAADAPRSYARVSGEVACRE